MTQREFGRRDFLKLAGVTSVVGGGALAATTMVPKAAKAEYNEPVSPGIKMAIKYLDKPNFDLPPYADGSKMERIHTTFNAFNNPDLQKKSFGGGPWVFPYMEKRKQKCVEGVPGFSLRDLAFGSAVEKSSGNPILMDWGVGFSNMNVEAAGRWEDTPENNAKMIKKYAFFVGAGATGICEMRDEWYFLSDEGYTIELTDNDDELVKDDVNMIKKIPHKAMKYAIAMTLPLDGAVAKYTPTRFGSASDNLGYSQMSEVSSKVAQFIREIGWRAIPMGNDTALSIPIGLAAGLGELGRHGLLISPEFGSNCKVFKVITDLPLAVDKSISFGAAEFCKTCGKCAEACPSQSISKEIEPSYDVACPSNLPNSKKWKINSWTCLEYWVENGGGCYVCMRNCTYSKQQTWVHDVVKVVASKTKMFNSVFAKMDDAFGYGRTWEYFDGDDIDDWWTSDDTRMMNWNRNM